MKTQEDVLSFHDLEVQRAISYLDENGNLVEVALRYLKLDIEEMSMRLIHTFLEWDLYDGYIYNLGWSLAYTCQGYEAPIIAGTNVDTLQEAEIIAIKKVSRFLGEQVHLESMELSAGLLPDISEIGENFYKVLNGAEEYRGMVEIARTEQLK